MCCARIAEVKVDLVTVISLKPRSRKVPVQKFDGKVVVPGAQFAYTMTRCRM
jgi:hypothetical protein